MAHVTAKAERGFPTPRHDHQTCVDEAVARAEALFQVAHLKLTDQRRAVLTDIVSSHKALGAYEIQERLAQAGLRLAPIAIYRALEALLAVGAVHRLESRNAYFACHATHARDARLAVLVCEDCCRVAEIPARSALVELDRAVAATGFLPARMVIELAGRCRDCQTAPALAPQSGRQG